MNANPHHIAHLYTALGEFVAIRKELKDEHDELVTRAQRAARDEGELSLFDLDGE